MDPDLGYAHADYARAFEDSGQPLHLARSNGWILARRIGETEDRDAIGCYPFFACRDWSRLGEDLEAIEGQLVSLALVPIPFGAYTPELLAKCFPDVCRPFKQHLVVDLGRPPEEFVSSHHRRNVKKALKAVTVEVCPDPSAYLDEWSELYGQLIARHQIQGIAAFSRASFERQLRVPGLEMLRAVHDGETVGMILWILHDSVGYYHLAAYTEEGYELRASFALFWESIRIFRERELRWLNLGANAGVAGSQDDGLARFKRGWSTGEKEVFFCGRILDAERYHRLSGGEQEEQTFFPAYRRGTM